MSRPEESPGDRPDPVEEELRRAGERVRANLARRGAELVDVGRKAKARDSMLEIMRARSPAEPRATKRRGLAFALAAAAVLLALALALRFWPGKDSGPTPLGTEGVRIRAPVGAVSSFSPFSWEGDLPPGGFFEIVIRDEAGNDIGSWKVQEHAWSPPEGTHLPEGIRWQVRVRDAFQEPRLPSEWAHATLSH